MNEVHEHPRLRAADPTLGDPAPAPESLRYNAIRTSARRRPSRALGATRIALGTVAATLAIGVAISVLLPGQRQSAAAAVADAVARTSTVQTLRVDYLVVGQDINMRARMDSSGSDWSFHEDEIGLTETRIGDRIWFEQTGVVLVRPAAEGSRDYAPFGESSRAVLSAVLKDGIVTDLGEEEVRGEPARHYRVDTSPAGLRELAAVDPSMQRWFAFADSAGPDGMLRLRGLDLWVADDVVSRVRITMPHPAAQAKDLSVTSEFYDLNAPIVIAPPKGG